MTSSRLSFRGASLLKGFTGRNGLVSGVFLSTILVSALLAFAELLQPGTPFHGILTFWRIPLGAYLVLFPVGFLLNSFLFIGKKHILDLEGFALSIALSISVNTVAVLLANLFFSIPISLHGNLLVLLPLSMLFFALYVFREALSPLAADFGSNYHDYLEEKRPRFVSLFSRLADSVFFLCMLGFGILVLASLVPAEHELSRPFVLAGQLLQPLFIALSPGSLFAAAFFPKISSLKKLLPLVVFSSLAFYAVSLALFSIAGQFFGLEFSPLRLLTLLMLLTSLSYLLFNVRFRLIPFTQFILGWGR